jgi:hypothetical protein
MQKYLTCLLGMICFACAAAAVPAEYEINLVRNAAFQPGLDRQGPKDWMYWPVVTNMFDEGRGQVEFFDGGMTVAGPATLMQFDLFDDITPAYKISCRMKSEGGKGQVQLRPRNQIKGCVDYTLTNSKLGDWEVLELSVTPTNHYGFGMAVRAPDGAKLSISDLRVTAVFPPTETAGNVRLGDAAACGICLPENPNWVECLAAHELQVNIYLVSGVRLPVYAGGNGLDGSGYIRIKNLKKMIPDKPIRVAPAGEPEANGFRIICADGNVDLTGGNDAGLLAGALHLSELCGVKFYAPKVFAVKTNRELKIPAMDIARQPAFEWADGTHNHELTWTPWKYGFLYSESSVAPSDKANPPGSSSWVHPPKFLAPLHMYGKSHPDYYAMVKGERLGDPRVKKTLAYLNLCLGNPDLQKHVAERISRLMDMYPHTKYFSIAQGDGPGWCECDMCTALDVDKEILTDRLIAYANAVAEITSKKHPDRKLVILAYGKGREDLPLREKLHPNVAVQYAFWPSSWPVWEATACQQNQLGMKLLDDWNALTGTNLTLFLYPVNTYENAEKIKLAASKGIRGFYHCGWRGDFPETTIYTSGRLIWDPEADVESMLDEIMPVIYGSAAAPYMREYFDMHHAFVRNCVEHPEQRRLYRDNNAHRYRRLPMPHAVKALELLTRAEAAAADNELALILVQKEKYKMLFGYINEFNAMHPAIPADLFEDYALKLAELVKLARTCREPYATYLVPFSEWLYQTTGALDFDRRPYRWFNDNKIDAFLADPVNTLKTRIYLQKEVENGVELPAKAWLGSRYYEQYQGQPAAVLRRKSSSESRVRAYFKLDTLPAGDAQLDLQGLDNEKAEIAEIEITINGQKIFAGPVAYPKNKWGWHTYKIPAGILAQGENVMAIVNTMGDYKDDVGGGEAGPAEEALAQNYNWGWCMVGSARIVFNKEQGLTE